MNPTGFHSYYSLQDFEHFIEIFKAEPRDRKAYQQCKIVFTHALVDFLLDLHAQSPLPPIEHSAEHQTGFSQAWNLLLNQKKPDSFYFFERIFSPLLSLDLPPKTEMNAWNQENLKDHYETWVARIHEGSFEDFDLGPHSPDHQCFDCAQTFSLQFKHWQGQYHVQNHELTPGTMTINTTISKPKPCLPQGNLSVEVTFESGDIYFADWFRIPAFTQAVEDLSQDKYMDTKSINFKAGVLYHIERFAKEHQFVSVNIGNSSPHVCIKDDILVVGRLDEDVPDRSNSGFSLAGTVCTDLWNATFIDRKQLIALVATQTGSAQAESVVDQYLKDHDVGHIKMSPGRYLLNFNPLPAQFEASFQSKEGEVFPSNMEKFFTLQKISDLNLKKKIKLP